MARVRLYPSPRRSGYQELLTYYPVYYREVFEMDAILKYFGDLCDVLEKQTEQAYLNYFLLEADDETLKHWEDVFGIHHAQKRTLDERRSIILGKLCSRDHIGEPEIRETIAAYTPNEVWVDFDLGIIYIVIQGNVFDEESLIETLYEKVPAHLEIDMKIEIHKQFRSDLTFGMGGAIGSIYHTAPVDIHSESRQTINIGMVAVEPENFITDKHEPESGSVGFYQTRVKGKLVG